MVTYTTVTSPTYANADKTVIGMLVMFDHLQFAIQFGASVNDTEPHGVELYNRAIAGDFGQIAEYVEPVKPV